MSSRMPSIECILFLSSIILSFLLKSLVHYKYMKAVVTVINLCFPQSQTQCPTCSGGLCICCSLYQKCSSTYSQGPSLSCLSGIFSCYPPINTLFSPSIHSLPLTKFIFLYSSYNSWDCFITYLFTSSLTSGI